MIQVGDIRHRLQLQERFSINGEAYFKCICLDCGSATSIRRNKFGRTKTCGCAKRKRGIENHQFRGHGFIHLAKWNSYKRNAEARGLEFTITIEAANNIIVSQDFKCALSGVQIDLWHDAKSRRATASLDRIDNNKGYVISNVHWVHKKINQIKMDMNVVEFKDWCERVTYYAKQ